MKESEEKPKKKRKKAPIKREPSSSLEMAEREETRPKVKKAAEESEKEHKKPWQEKYASPEEIETFLNNHIYLRRNVVTLRTEWREPSYTVGTVLTVYLLCKFHGNLFISRKLWKAQNVLLECRIFVSGKQDEPKGWLPRFVQISRTTHSDYLNTPIGII